MIVAKKCFLWRKSKKRRPKTNISSSYSGAPMADRRPFHGKNKRICLKFAWNYSTRRNLMKSDVTVLLCSSCVCVHLKITDCDFRGAKIKQIMQLDASVPKNSLTRTLKHRSAKKLLTMILNLSSLQFQASCQFAVENINQSLDKTVLTMKDFLSIF